MQAKKSCIVIIFGRILKRSRPVIDAGLLLADLTENLSGLGWWAGS